MSKTKDSWPPPTNPPTPTKAGDAPGTASKAQAAESRPGADAAQAPEARPATATAADGPAIGTGKATLVGGSEKVPVAASPAKVDRVALADVGGKASPKAAEPPVHAATLIGGEAKAPQPAVPLAGHKATLIGGEAKASQAAALLAGHKATLIGGEPKAPQAAAPVAEHKATLIGGEARPTARAAAPAAREAGVAAEAPEPEARAPAAGSPAAPPPTPAVEEPPPESGGANAEANGTPPSVLAKLLESATGDQPIFEALDDLFKRGNIERAVQRKVATMVGRIAELWPKLPNDIQKIILRIANEERAPTEQVTAEWLVQRLLFLEIGRHFRLKRVDRFSSGRPESFLALTERGSLITGSPPDKKGERGIEYIRIPSRVQSWKEAATYTGVIETVRRGHRARLPGMRTSPVQYILLIPAERASEFSHIANVTRTGIRSTFVGG